jgi:hypothetical protein
MASPNGTAASRRLRVTYDTLTYTVELGSGETVALAGYRRGTASPISVEIEVEGAWAEWSEETPSDDERAALTEHRYLAKRLRADRLLRQNLLCAVLVDEQGKPLSKEIAAVLASDAGPWESVLVDLGWWTVIREATTTGEANAGEPALSTGSPALPDSSARTTDSRSRTVKR